MLSNKQRCTVSGEEAQQSRYKALQNTMATDRGKATNVLFVMHAGTCSSQCSRSKPGLAIDWSNQVGTEADQVGTEADQVGTEADQVGTETSIFEHDLPPPSGNHQESVLSETLTVSRVAQGTRIICCSAASRRVSTASISTVRHAVVTAWNWSSSSLTSTCTSWIR